VSITAEIPPTNDALNNVSAQGTSRRYLGQFLANVRSRPIPDATRVEGTQTS